MSKKPIMVFIGQGNEQIKLKAKFYIQLNPQIRKKGLLNKKALPVWQGFFSFGGDPGEIRTLDPMIKSHLLYQLSYGVVVVFDNASISKAGCKYTIA